MGLINMNKSDLSLTSVVIVVALISILILKIVEPQGSKKALVYYQNKVVLTIDLNDVSYAEYNIEGKNGNILIIREDGKVKVEQENSPLHLCSKQGWIESVYESIVCLPNEVVIKIIVDNNIDAVV
jgi:hypothetical protein